MNLVSVKQFSADNPIFTEQSMRWWIFNEYKNGLHDSGGLIRVGKKILIDPVKFEKWVRDHGAGETNQKP